MTGMRQYIASIVVMTLGAFPVAADSESGRTLMERGVELFMEGLRDEMAPTIENLQGFAEQAGPSMRSFLQEMGPAFAEVLSKVEDWTLYHPPEMLPNGDIILRKRVAPDAKPETTDPKVPAGTSTDI